MEQPNDEIEFEIDLFPRLTKVVDWLSEKLSPHYGVELCLSEHIKDEV